MKSTHSGQMSSMRQFNDESIRKRKKFEEDLREKKRNLREEFKKTEEKGIISGFLIETSPNEIKVIYTS